MKASKSLGTIKRTLKRGATRLGGMRGITAADRERVFTRVRGLANQPIAQEAKDRRVHAWLVSVAGNKALDRYGIWDPKTRREALKSLSAAHQQSEQFKRTEDPTAKTALTQETRKLTKLLGRPTIKVINAFLRNIKRIPNLEE